MKKEEPKVEEEEEFGGADLFGGDFWSFVYLNFPLPFVLFNFKYLISFIYYNYTLHKTIWKIINNFWLNPIDSVTRLCFG